MQSIVLGDAAVPSRLDLKHSCSTEEESTYNGRLMTWHSPEYIEQQLANSKAAPHKLTNYNVAAQFNIPDWASIAADHPMKHSQTRGVHKSEN